MKEIKFKIIELENYQVLVEKDFDNSEDEDMYLVVVSFYSENMKITHNFSFDKEENRNAYFTFFDNKDAEKVVNKNLIFLR